MLRSEFNITGAENSQNRWYYFSLQFILTLSLLLDNKNTCSNLNSNYLF